MRLLGGIIVGKIEEKVVGSRLLVVGSGKKKDSKMNKRGDVPITILVIGVFTVCALALFTFFVADFKMSNSFVGLKIMEEMNSDIDEYLFYKNGGKDEGSLNQLFSVVVEDGVEYIKKSKFASSGLGFFGDENELLFSVRYPTP